MDQRSAALLGPDWGPTGPEYLDVTPNFKKNPQRTILEVGVRGMSGGPASGTSPESAPDRKVILPLAAHRCGHVRLSMMSKSPHHKTVLLVWVTTLMFLLWFAKVLGLGWVRFVSRQPIGVLFVTQIVPGTRQQWLMSENKNASRLTPAFTRIACLRNWTQIH